MRILILNDEEDSLLLLHQALTREFVDVEVLRFSEPESALAYLRAQKVDVIVTDNRMPQLSGIEFVRRQRHDDQTTPIIMLTGSDERKAEALAAGVTTFVSSASWSEIRRAMRETVAAWAKPAN